MRILNIIAQKPLATGSGIYLTETMKGFAALGHEQAVISGIYDEKDMQAVPEGILTYPVYFNSRELPFPIAGMSDEMPYPSTRYRDMDDAMVNAFKKAFTSALQKAVAEFRPDVLLCHHLYLLTALTAELYSGKLPIWGICHGTDLRQLIKNPLRREEIRQGIHKLDKIFCIQQAQKELAMSLFGLKDDRISIVANGYNSRIFHKEPPCPPHKDIRLLFAGKISEKKGVFQLLRAMSLLPPEQGEISLTLAGGWSSPKQKQQAEELISSCGHKVRLLGNLTQEELAKEYHKADIFILPSFYDALPLVLAEAMACGLKVICTDLPGIRPWMDSFVPRHNICFVAPPAMMNGDDPVAEELPAFRQRLADAILHTTAIPKGEEPDLSLVSWEGVCQRILA